MGRGHRHGALTAWFPPGTTWQQDPSGDVAQLVAHLLCKQGVEGSSPFVSTLSDQEEAPGRVV